ncbi:MAG TPA: hypothetical protein VJV03_12960 [Pyrinomonadaceae bacterium]|nr:hypothetical protein [Pyrinomonadaceae bacterium]
MNPVHPETYADVFMHLQNGNLDYVVIGGLAAALHGFLERPVSDLDLAVRPVPQSAQALMSVLASAGFVATLPLPIMLVPVMRLFDSRAREIDVLVRSHVPFEELWQDAKMIHVSGAAVRVASLAHLIRSKRINGHAEDLERAEQLETFAKTRPTN